MDIFTEIGIIIVVAMLITVLMRLLKQPLIIGYIIAGLVVSPYFLDMVNSPETLQIFSQMGVALLLFIVGLHLSPKVIKEVGKVSLFAGLGQIIFTSLIGFSISRLLGFSIVISFYLAIALTFASTIIVMKLLFDKGDLEKLYGKIAVGILIIQDLVALIFLIMISSSGINAASLALGFFIKGIILIGLLVVISIYVLPKLSGFFAKSQELLFLFSIAWGFGLAVLFHYLGFSIEIGALIAGVTLSMSPYHFEISSKMRPLRDFFVILFFILLGSQISFDSIGNYIVPIIIFSLFVIIGHPVIIMTLMGVVGHNKRNSFLTGSALSQISEFSLIVVALGVSTQGKLGIPGEILSIVTMVFLITTGISTYFVMYAKRIYPYLANILTIFEKPHHKLEKKKKEGYYDVILFGQNRIGYDFLEVFKKEKMKFIVVDYDPEVIRDLGRKEINHKYGDADDNEFLDELDFFSLKLSVSTIPDFDTNMLIVNRIRQINKDAIILVISHSIEEAEELYKVGASYVLMPHFLGGQQGSEMVDKFKFSKDKFHTEKEKHLRYLKKRKDIGHEHPTQEKHKRWN